MSRQRYFLAIVVSVLIVSSISAIIAPVHAQGTYTCSYKSDTGCVVSEDNCDSGYVPVECAGSTPASCLKNGQCTKPIGLKDRTINFYNTSLGIGLALALGILIYGGIAYSVSSGNPGRIGDAKKWIWAATTGILILFSSYIILNYINPKLNNPDEPLFETQPSADVTTMTIPKESLTGTGGNNGEGGAWGPESTGEPSIGNGGVEPGEGKTPTSGPAYRPCVASKPTGGSNYYVATNGNNNNNGSRGSPWKTLHYAVTKVAANQNNTIHLGAGTFSETGSAVTLPSGINLIGAGRRATTYKGLIKIKDGTKNQTISSMKFDGWENKNASVSKYSALDLGATSYCVTVQDVLVEGFYGRAIIFGGEQFEFYNSELRNNGKHDAPGNGTALNGLKDSYLHDFVVIEEDGKGGMGMGGSIGKKMTNVEFYNMTMTAPNSTAGGWCKSGGTCQKPFNIEFFNVDAKEVDIHDSTFNSTLSPVQWQP